MITRKNQLIPQNQSRVWDTHNAIVQPYNAHGLPYTTVYGGN